MADTKPISDEIEEIKYNLREAYDFYRKFIYNKEHQSLLRMHGFHIAGSIAPVNWEVFAAILTGDEGKAGYGSDLEKHEVKSSVDGSSFEYQYHLNGGQTKLKDDMVVNHIFVSYSSDYKNIEVRLVPGGKLKHIFESWMPGLIKNYQGDSPRQRYRKSLSYGLIKAEGLLLLKTNNGELVENV